MEKKILYVGMDVHKKSIDVAITDGLGNGKVRSYGKIDGTLEALDKLVQKLKSPRSDRHLTSKGHSCSVVAPSLIPKRSGDRIKTDRRDAVNLVRLFRAGELTSIYVPTVEDETMRDLLRCRVDIRRIERKTRQQLLAFLLRHGLHYPGKKNWTKGHMNWLAGIKLTHRAQQIVLLEYIDAANECTRRIQ